MVACGAMDCSNSSTKKKAIAVKGWHKVLNPDFHLPKNFLLCVSLKALYKIDTKNAFYFILKAVFVLKMFKVFIMTY